jgi:hypothetical protein
MPPPTSSVTVSFQLRMSDTRLKPCLLMDPIGKPLIAVSTVLIFGSGHDARTLYDVQTPTGHKSPSTGLEKGRVTHRS